MKTFEEAARLFLPDPETGVNNADVEIRKRFPTMEEVASSPISTELVRLLMVAVDKEARDRGAEPSVGVLGLSTFVQGVLVGLEMERQELPKGLTDGV